MKKIFTIVMFLLLIISCHPNIVVDNIEDSQKVTTVRIQSLPKDTVVISIDEDKLYIFDENNLVKTEIKNANNSSNDFVVINLDALLFLVLALLIVISVGVIIFD